MNALMLVVFYFSFIVGFVFLVLFILSFFKERFKARRKKYGIAVIVLFVIFVLSTFGYDATLSDEQRAQMEQEAQKKAEQEAKEKAEQESQEKAEQEAKEKAEQESQEKAEQDAKKEDSSEAKKASDSTNNKEKGYRDESIKGRGRADSGREEPDYINLIGYVVVSSSQAYELEKSDDFVNKEPWQIPTYVKDKQFWNETDTTLNHKTEVVVKEQILEHEGYGVYSGYLLVKPIDGKKTYYIDVANFVAKPYWTYDVENAASVGDFVAEFNQKSDYYPVTGNGNNAEKVELSDGTIVLVKDCNSHRDNTIEAVVWKEWKYGYGGVSVYFNKDDLKILY